MGERDTWAALRRADGPVTDFYLLGALDLRRDADGSIVGAPTEERVFRAVLGRTLGISAVVSLVCLVLGYPVAYVIAAQPPERANVLLFAMVHVLLPFMVLPLCSVMRAIPPTYARAAAALGAKPLTAFRRVYLPMTLAGVAAGCLMVFIQAPGYYITPALVGGGEDQMISHFIAFYASRTVNWGMAAALSIMLLTTTLVLYAVYDRIAPILTIVPLSFSAGSFFYHPLPGLSLRWYEDFFTSSFWLPALKNSLIAGTSATTLATMLGTLAALGLWRARFPAQALVLAVLISPMAVPVIIVAVGVYFAFAPLGLTDGYLGLILAHATLGVPFVALLLAGPGQRTLPRQMFWGINDNISLTIACAATLLIAISLVLMIAVGWLQRRGARMRQAR